MFLWVVLGPEGRGLGAGVGPLWAAHARTHARTPRAHARTLTFSRSCLSCFVRASREHMVCCGATTVQIHLPSLSWAELYTCQLSSGLVGSTWRGAAGVGVGRK